MTAHPLSRGTSRDASRRPIVSDGISQQQRAQPALQDGYFNVDETKLTDLLAMMGRYAAGVRFRDERNRDDGTWEAYFSADETMIIADILSIDLDGYAAAFEQMWHDTGGDANRLTRDVSLHEMPAWKLAALIDRWFTALRPSQTPAGRDLYGLLSSMANRLQGEFERLRLACQSNAAAVQTAKSATNQATKKATAPTPAMMAFDPAMRGDSGANGGGNGNGDARMAFSFRTNFYAFLKAIDMLQKGAARMLPASLASQQHDPSVGMLIAFAQLYQKLQGRVNRFTHRHLDFYYDQVLLAKLRPARADKTCLVLQASLPGRDIPIAPGTEFSAGQDAAKRDIVFSADTPLLVGDLQVQALHTLYFDRDANSAPENALREPAGGGERQYATGCYLNSIDVPAEVVTDPEKLFPQPLLGAPKAARDAMFLPEARIGFAIASRVLALREGRRRIRITLTFDEGANGEDLFAQRIAALAEAIDGGGNDSNDGNVQTDKQQQLAVEDAFFRVFRRMFAVAVTCEQGWHPVAEYIPLYQGVDRNFDIRCEPHTLLIDFELAADAPAVTPYVQAVHGEQYETVLPMVRLLLHADYMYPYGLLDRLPLRKIAIDVGAEGCKQLSLFNNVGQLSPAAPFQPFGPIPAIGSYFIVGSAEMAGKRLGSFGIDVEWGGLPSGHGGFRDWYAGYDYKEGAAVTAAASVLVDGKWLPAEHRRQPDVVLFDRWDDERDLEAIRTQRRLSFEQVIHHARPAERLSADTAFAYGPLAKNGFFKLTLNSPEFAFGHKEYPVALAEALGRNAAEKKLKRHEPLPNPPYTPLINAISFSYTAFAHIDLAHTNGRDVDWNGDGDGDRMFHLHPLGWENLAGMRRGHATLLPHIGDSGNLYIGLSGTADGQIVNLLFHLHPDSLPCNDSEKSDSPHNPAGQAGSSLRWSYLSGNRWIPFGTRVVADTTHGFMVSGIVSLELPPDIDDDSTVMPRGLYWLRLSAEHDLNKVCSLYAVYTNGLQVSRVHGNDDNGYSTADVPLPVGAIRRSRKTIAGLGKIVQPVASFGGAPAETREQLRTRISGRLRHKNRAVSPYDYQTLILEKFPEIYKVKCFPNMRMDADPQRWIAPGHVLIVALPQLPAGIGSGHMPTLDGHLIGEVRQYAAGLASPWAQIDVRNPVYEHLQVRCTVKFRKGFGGGYYVKQLNRDISRFLSPWGGGGYSVHFGWRVRQHDVEAFILGLDYVEFVTGFSMLRISPDGSERYGLLDTAARKGGEAGHRDIVPDYPWSIAVPLQRHAIAIGDDLQPRDPKAVGLAALEVGTTFIIGTEE